MREWILILISLSAIPAGAMVCDDVDRERLEKEIQRINQRYDDFFQYQEGKERHQRKLEEGVAEVKALKETREKELERARQAYRSTPKDYAKEEALRIEWEARQKEKTKQMELARLCEVQQRAKAQDILKRGRKIPEVKEFDLEE